MNTNEFLETVFRGTSELDRDALFLRFYSSYSFADIAGILSISVDKARSRCRRGVKIVMRNVLDATPVQKVSLDDILRFDIAPTRDAASVKGSIPPTECSLTIFAELEHGEQSEANENARLKLAGIAMSLNPGFNCAVATAVA